MDHGHEPSVRTDKRSDSCCLADLAIEKVVVYLEKAEVTRSVKYEILEGQILECTFEQFPSSIDKDSIRIEVERNSVAIQDVTFNVRPITGSSDQTERMTQIKESIKTEKLSQESLEAKKQRLTKQKNVLDAFANTLIESQNSATNEGPVSVKDGEKEKKITCTADAYNPKHLETIGNFFQLYSDNGEKFDESLLEIEEKLKLSRSKMCSLENEMKEIEMRQDELLYRELFVTLEGRIDGEFEMYISYVVNNCTWTPIYDVRVSNSTGSMQINYYGLVKQKCGEDWYQPSAFNLSTAEPGVGGTVPEVGVQKVQFKNQLCGPAQDVPSPVPFSPTLSSPNLRKSTSRLSFRKSRVTSNTFDSNTVNGVSPFVNNMENDTQNDAPDSSEKTSAKQFSTVSASFDIARPPFLVTCDNTECKIMIAVIYLEPHYQHVTVPKNSPYAFLRSVSTNTSKFTLLEGPVNIYIDSNYIGKTKVTTVCPCEEFYCNLGVDKGIKVNYLPMFKYKENYQKSMCVTFKQEIQVVNNHERPIKILVIDQLPLSTDEKIKVTLIEPNIKNLEKYDKQKPIRINTNRQIEWDCEIGSKDKKEMVLKFSVEHPYGRDIEVMQLK